MRRSKRATCNDKMRQTMLDKYTHHVTLYARAGGLLKPKHRMVFHMIIRSRELGHPSLQSTYRDESLNGVIGRIARSAHRNTFLITVHPKLHLMMALGGASSMQMH